MNENTKEVLTNVKNDLTQANPMLDEAEEMLAVMKEANEPGWQQYEQQIRAARQRTTNIRNALQRKGI